MTEKPQVFEAPKFQLCPYRQLHKSDLLGFAMRAARTALGAPVILGASASSWATEVLETDLQDFEPPVSTPAATKSWSEAYKPFESFQDCDRDFCPEIVMLPAGAFLMGSPETEAGRAHDEGLRHKVTISQPFAIRQYEVMYQEYDVFAEAMGHKQPLDRGTGRGTRPVTCVRPGRPERAYTDVLKNT